MKRLAALIASVALSGCAMKPADFAAGRPVLTLEDYFAGHTKAWGLFEDRFGRVRRQFTVEIEGRMVDGALVMDESFLYDDGETQRRVWRITKRGANLYEGVADDVIGSAKGVASGNSLNWTYTVDLKIGEGTLRVDFDDWMFLQPGGTMINRAHVSKLGVEIGSVTLFFTKAQAPTPAS